MHQSKNLLITGAAGFIGSNFVHYWLKKYGESGDGRLIALDALTYAGNKCNLDPVLNNSKLTFVHGNICNTGLIEQLLTQHQIDTLVHFAAESHVDRSITGPDAFIETNIVGTHSLLKAAKAVWLAKGIDNHRFHHISTDEVYGTLAPNEPAFTEATAYAPNSPYAASKAASDHLVRAYHHTYGLNITISNCSNNYGPYHFPEKLIPLIITNLLHDKPLPVYGDGQQIRDWLYVEDHVRGIDLVLKKGAIGQNYNIGSHNEWKNIDIVNLICQFIDKSFREDNTLKDTYPFAKSAHRGHSKALIRYVTDRPGHDRRYAIDASKISLELGYRPKETFDSGIKKTVEWYLHNKSWWQAH